MTNPEHLHEHGHNEPVNADPDKWGKHDVLIAFLGMSAMILLIIATTLQVFGPVPFLGID